MEETRLAGNFFQMKLCEKNAWGQAAARRIGWRKVILGKLPGKKRSVNRSPRKKNRMCKQKVLHKKGHKTFHSRRDIEVFTFYTDSLFLSPFQDTTF